jgi:hypothetical protein
MAINTSKVIVGGLVAGIVMNVLGYLGQGLLLGDRMMSEMIGAAPSLEGRGMGTGALTGRVLTQFAVGLLLVWLYAAMRPRFGPGMKTAALAAFAVWLCGFLFYLDWLYLGMMSPTTYAFMSIMMMVILLIAGGVGAMLYKEESLDR